jgi:tetratricopeptide (TPR) repeat protein
LANGSLIRRPPCCVIVSLLPSGESEAVAATSQLAIAADPRSGDFGFIELINVVDALTRSGEARLCLKLYELWQQHHPADPLRYAACFNHGALLAGSGQPEAAATAYEEAVRLAPDFLPAYINGGLALESLGLFR